MSVSRFRSNRPFKFGDRDRRELIVQDSEAGLRAINDVLGNPIFLGRSIIGTAVAEDKWQIRKVQYDSNSGVISVTWPQNSDGQTSCDYEFIWNAESDLTITGITQANPAVVTVSSIGNLVNGDLIVIQNVAGMTEVNYDGSNIYTVSGVSGSTFQLFGIDSSGFTAYSSGGTVIFGDVINYTYA